MGSKRNNKKPKQTSVPVTPSEMETVNGERAREHRPGVQTIPLLAAILLLTVVVYSNSISNGFVNWDDNKNVYENISIRELSARNIKVYFTKPLIAMYTPFIYLSYAIDYKIGGLDPRIYHATNLLLHLLNIILLFFIVRLLTRRIEVAVIAALLFAVHPLNTGAVAPVSTRGTLLYAFFFLAAFLSYIQYLRNNFALRYLALTLVLFLMALLSKSAAVVLPLVLLLTDYYYRRKFNPMAIAEKIPFFLLSLTFGILTVVFREDAGHIGSRDVFSLFDRIFLVGYSIVFYLFKFLIPVKLSAYYPYPVKIDGLLPLWLYLTPLVIAPFILLVYKLQNYRRELIFGSLFFLINIILVLKIVPMGGEIVCDRYAYLPYIGFFLIIGWAYCWITDRFHSSSGRIKYVLVIAVAVFGMAFSAISYERSKVWKDSLTLYNDVLEKYPLVHVVYNNRGNYKSEQKDYSGAIDDYNKAILLYPRDASVYYNRGTAKSELGKDYAGAVEDYNKAIELNPGYALAYYNRGKAKSELGKDYAGAMEDYNKAIELNPGYALAYNNRGLVKFTWRKDYAGAMEDYNKSIELNPTYLPSFLNRALLKAERGNTEGAFADYDRVLEMDPRNFRAYYERGNIKIARKDFEGASGDYSRAIALNPYFAEAYLNRGNVRVIQERYGESVADYNEVLRLTPQNAGVYFNRARSRWFASDKNGACADWRRSLELGAKEAAAVIQEHCR